MYEFLFIKSFHNQLILDSINTGTSHKFDFSESYIYNSDAVEIEDFEDIRENAIKTEYTESSVENGKVYVNTKYTSDEPVYHNRVYYLNSDNVCVMGAIIEPEIRSEINIDIEIEIESDGRVTS